MESRFGKLIRALGMKQHLYWRQDAPLLEMEAVRLCRIEKGMVASEIGVNRSTGSNLKRR